MLSKFQRFSPILIVAGALFGAMPSLAQTDVKAAVLAHLKTSRDFTLKVADQMPEASYGFKLTPPQMSFAEQMVHLAQAQAEFLGPVSGERLNPGKPASMNKKDVIEFVRSSFDRSIEKVSKLTNEQLSKTYSGGE